ncbi:amidohydrolase [Nannizzia gypsea CBS 118893]|uniref:Amidohydrolase n=1 Tax=Arthroderma gypseum (strain ATCC MYA-4604 / CBS 118893) TaxID=535722 RepID=E4UX30_ARTGP|nr:amidohydrolase [Nannizzia gypsea CBS 118893]EFR01830.1 amidohydrolase [Nannizzia gypsea CBS 118893]
MDTPIIDSHVHLWTSSQLDTLAWHSPSNPLGSQHSVQEYRDAAISPLPVGYHFKGFVYIETDRISSLAPHGWTHVLEEVSFISHIACGIPLEGDRHVPTDKVPCLAIIPWAPVPLGPDGLEMYMAKVQEKVNNNGKDAWGKVKGVRYLLQDKPRGIMLEDGFIQGLRWLGQRGLTFDLGVDARSGGLHQLEETVELSERLYQQGSSQVKLILNHLCKPNLRISPSETYNHREFIEWKRHITSLSRHPLIYIKLSGLFSELLPLPAVEVEQDNTDQLSFTVDAIQPWTDVVFDTFGTARIMFGSDWPVCNVGGGGNPVTWTRWMKVVQLLLEKRGLADDDKNNIWYLTAQKAYGISPS